MNEINMEQTVHNARSVLCSISQLDGEHPLVSLVLELYGAFRNGETPAVMRRSADGMKTASLQQVI